MTHANYSTPTELAIADSTSRMSRASVGAAIFLVLMLCAFAGGAWLFASGALYGLTVGSATALTVSAHALILGVALRVGQ